MSTVSTHKHSLQTRAVHAGEGPRVDGSAVTPIFQSATFVFEGGDAKYEDVRYTRCNNNPSQLALGLKIANLESTEACVPMASGMAAISTSLLAFLKSGDHLLVQNNLYGGTHSLVHGDFLDLGIQVETFNNSECSSWDVLVKPNTKVIYVETISNPLTEVPDLPAIVAFARKHNLTSIIDNTFAGPVNFRPAEHGFDVVCESCTKSMNGHSDLIAGSVSGTKEVVTRVMRKLGHLGGTIDPHACFLLQRGLKTIVLRVRQQNQNALALAQMLEKHPAVSRVYYPGLASHPMHALAARIFDKGGAGGVFSFELKGGVDVAEAMMQGLTLGLVAPSLGGIETLVTRPATTTHVGQTAAQRAAMNIGDGLVRVAVGIEDTEDLLLDFSTALEAALAAAAAL